jgi:hypothetical protein
MHGALGSLGADLWLLGHNEPQSPLPCPYARVTNGLDAAAEQAEQLVEDQDSSIAALESDGLCAANLLERERLWRGVEQSEPQRSLRLRALRAYQRLYAGALAACRPHVVMVWNGEHPQEIVLRSLARRTGAHVCVLERGPFEGTLHPDDQGILGASTAAERTTWSWPSNRQRDYWHDTFDEFREQLLKRQSTWWGQPERIGGHALRRRLGIDFQEPVALFAGQVDADVQGFLFGAGYRDNAEAFGAFTRAFVASGQPGFVLGKHHPKSTTSVERYQSQLGAARGIWSDEASIHDCLALADRVASVNSTVLFEALLLEKPCLMLGRSVLSGAQIAYSCDGQPDARVIRRWMDASDHRSRMARFRRRCAHLLNNDLFTMRPEDENIGLRGVADLAHWLTTRATGISPSVPNGVSFIDPWNEPVITTTMTQLEPRMRPTTAESAA